jgi:hypothetical protein
MSDEPTRTTRPLGTGGPSSTSSPLLGSVSDSEAVVRDRELASSFPRCGAPILRELSCRSLVGSLGSLGALCQDLRLKESCGAVEHRLHRSTLGSAVLGFSWLRGIGIGPESSMVGFPSLAWLSGLAAWNTPAKRYHGIHGSRSSRQVSLEHYCSTVLVTGESHLLYAVLATSPQLKFVVLYCGSATVKSINCRVPG